MMVVVVNVLVGMVVVVVVMEVVVLLIYIFQAVRAALLSTQGFVISLPYCFLNSEVQTIVRWVRVSRMVGW